MTSKELMFIKDAQREFKALFGKRLVIDFGVMNQVDFSTCETKWLKKHFEILLAKHALSAEEVRIYNRAGRAKFTEKEKRVRQLLVEFSSVVLKEEYPVREAGKLIGRAHRIIYYYAKRTNVEEEVDINGAPHT